MNTEKRRGVVVRPCVSSPGGPTFLSVHVVLGVHAALGAHAPVSSDSLALGSGRVSAP